MPVPQLFKWSPRPDQTPTLDASPASQNPSRFGPFSTLHTNVRSMINGSSVYSQSPIPQSNTTTPKIPFLERFRRDQPPAPIAIPNIIDPPRDSSDSRSPLRPPHTAGSYMRTIAPLQDSREHEGLNRHPADVTLDRHPADVPLGYEASGGRQVGTGESTEDINDRRRRRRHRRRRHQHQNDHWVRRRSERGSCLRNVRGTAARGKLMASIISGLFLVTVLAIYLALALSRNDLGQEVHVLFILIVLATTIFFCHSLIRLCILVLHPPVFNASNAPIPAMTGPEGFHPVRPIQVHLARDEDLASNYDEERELNGNDHDREGEQVGEKPVPPPPPAYGLWRSSVRVDPNLLHWQRVDQPLPNANRSTSNLSALSHPQASRNASVSSTSLSTTAVAPAEESTGPRPPSYVSEDGVSYIVEAAPRSVAPSHTGVSDIHPAWRPGYGVTEVPMEEWPARRQGSR